MVCINQVKALLVTLVLLLAPLAQAVPIITTDLAEDAYITDAGLDWTWASAWGGQKTWLEDPMFHDGWRYATTSELDYLFENLKDSFLNGGSSIVSTAYWNDDGYNGSVDEGDLTSGLIESGSFTITQGAFSNGCGNSSTCDTFYVRDVSAVPEPATVWLFGSAMLGFLGLSRKNKAV